MKWFLNRIQEPSSHAGLAGIFSGISICVSGHYELGVPAIVTGVIAFIKADAKPL